jgi:hypothetical protein
MCWRQVKHDRTAVTENAGGEDRHPRDNSTQNFPRENMSALSRHALATSFSWWFAATHILLQSRL